jgi:lysophospholipase L1-like esterase
VIHFIEEAGMTEQDVILLLVGNNNVRLGQAAETMLREIEVLLHQIVTSEASPAVLLMKLTPVTNDDWPDDDETRTNNDTIGLFNEGLERLVAETYGPQGVTLVDSATTGDDRSPDGVHLNEGGYRKVAETFFEGLMESGLLEQVRTDNPPATAASSP